MVLEQSHADTYHRVEATALKVMALSLGTAYTSGGAHTHQWLPSRAPLLSLSFAVRHGRSWSHMGESKLSSTDMLYVSFMNMNIMYDTAMHIASAYIKVWFVWNIVGKCVFVSRMFLCKFPLCTDYFEGIFYFICKKGNKILYWLKWLQFLWALNALTLTLCQSHWINQSISIKSNWQFHIE